MGLKARLSSNCTKRANNGVNLVTSRKINTRLVRPITTTIMTGLHVHHTSHDTIPQLMTEKLCDVWGSTTLHDKTWALLQISSIGLDIFY